MKSKEKLAETFTDANMQHCPPQTPPKYYVYSASAAAITLILCGLLALILTAYVISIQPQRIELIQMYGDVYSFVDPYFYKGAGIWCGVACILCGVLTLFSVRKTAFMLKICILFAIVTFILSIVFVILSGYATSFERALNYGFDKQFGDEYDYFNARSYPDKASETISIVLCLISAISIVGHIVIIVTGSLLLPRKPKIKKPDPTCLYVVNPGQLGLPPAPGTHMSTMVYTQPVYTTHSVGYNAAPNQYHSTGYPQEVYSQPAYIRTHPGYPQPYEPYGCTTTTTVTTQAKWEAPPLEVPEDKSLDHDPQLYETAKDVYDELDEEH